MVENEDASDIVSIVGRAVMILTSVGGLLVFYLGEGKIASLGDHPIFNACCTIALTAAMLAIVWYFHNHIRDFF